MLAAVVVVLGLASTASANDTALAALGSKATVASGQYLDCTTRLCHAKTATVFLKADTAMAKHITARIKAGTIHVGTQCYRAVLV